MLENAVVAFAASVLYDQISTGFVRFCDLNGMGQFSLFESVQWFVYTLQKSIFTHQGVNRLPLNSGCDITKPLHPTEPLREQSKGSHRSMFCLSPTYIDARAAVNRDVQGRLHGIGFVVTDINFGSVCYATNTHMGRTMQTERILYVCIRSRCMPGALSVANPIGIDVGRN